MALEVSGALMVCGTNSGAGKSVMVTGLCRLLARQGIDVAPFKAQNMSNNAAVCGDGAEIGRAQYSQARAAGVEPNTDMNPLLIKPIDDHHAQLVVRGRPVGTMTAQESSIDRHELFGIVLESLTRLRQCHDVVIVEGAGSPAELNLLDRDLANLPLAARTGMPAIVVADIDRGGMLAAAYGTVALLPEQLRSQVRGFIVNRFRGDRSLLAPALDILEARTGLPVLGVVPFLGELVDAEDSLDLPSSGSTFGPAGGLAGGLDVAVVRTPHIANFTDLEPLAAESDLEVRYVTEGSALGTPDLVILPGSRAVEQDLGWMRARGIDRALSSTHAVVLGICGGYQMLGDSVDDPDQVESQECTTRGLGLLAVSTCFAPTKIVCVRRGSAFGCPVDGYEIHHGRLEVRDGSGWVQLDDARGRHLEGASAAGRVFGTSLHGLFEHDAFRGQFLSFVAARHHRTFRPSTVPFARYRAERHDAVADAIEENCDVDALLAIVRAGDTIPPVGAPVSAPAST
jgi:adenosylcobyric acid synthase